jgi:DNA (cytosine-5)-methyltransferase 1
MDKTELKIVDLFAGIGGFHYGIKAAASGKSLETSAILVSEIESSCQDVYKKNHNTEVQGDINNLDLTSNQTADIVTAGFPCQPFSNSGRKLGLSDPRGQFYFKIQEIIKGYNTKAFILENVPGIKHNGGGNYKSELAQNPQKIGKTMHFLEENLKKLHDYQIQWAELNSSNFGSPQVRKRVFIIGIHKDFNSSFDFDFKKSDQSDFKSIAEQLKNEELELTNKQEENIRSLMIRPPSYKDGMRRVGQAYLCPGGNVGQCYHSHGLVPTLTKVWARFLPIYFPHIDESLPTLGHRDFLPNEFYGKGYIRKASIRETYRLQGFPEEFKPHPIGRTAYEHAGNAVNIKVVESLSRNILRNIL